jgi:hypothetical protein
MASCQVRAFEDWLAEPITQAERLAEEAHERNLRAVQQQLQAMFGGQG